MTVRCRTDDAAASADKDLAEQGQCGLQDVTLVGFSNPDGPLTPEKALEKKTALQQDRSAYFNQFTRAFFSANGALQVTELQRSQAIALCHHRAVPHSKLVKVNGAPHGLNV